MSASRTPTGDPFTVELHAFGLGLMLYSPAVETLLEEGRDYMPAGEDLASPLQEMARDQRVVLLGTGSPQLDYVVHVWRGAPSVDLVQRAASHVRFGLDVAGGELCLRDGYDPMEWRTEGDGVRRVPMHDGYYAVDGLWLPDDQDAMIVHLFFLLTEERLPGTGWPILEYRVLD
jgi:hypothetical protein